MRRNHFTYSYSRLSPTRGKFRHQSILVLANDRRMGRLRNAFVCLLIRSASNTFSGFAFYSDGSLRRNCAVYYPLSFISSGSKPFQYVNPQYIVKFRFASLIISVFFDTVTHPSHGITSYSLRSFSLALQNSSFSIFSTIIWLFSTVSFVCFVLFYCI